MQYEAKRMVVTLGKVLASCMSGLMALRASEDNQAQEFVEESLRTVKDLLGKLGVSVVLPNPKDRGEIDLLFQSPQSITSLTQEIHGRLNVLYSTEIGNAFFFSTLVSNYALHVRSGDPLTLWAAVRNDIERIAKDISINPEIVQEFLKSPSSENQDNLLADLLNKSGVIDMKLNMKEQKDKAERLVFNALGENFSVPYLKSVIGVELLNYLTLVISISEEAKPFLLDALKIGDSTLGALDSNDRGRIDNVCNQILEFSQIASENGRDDISAVFQALNIALENIQKAPKINFGAYLAVKVDCGGCMTPFMSKYAQIIEKGGPEIEALEEMNNATCPFCGFTSVLPLPVAYIDREKNLVLILSTELGPFEWLENYCQINGIDLNSYKVTKVEQKHEFINLIRSPQRTKWKVRIKDFNLGAVVSSLRYIASVYSKNGEYFDAIRCYELCCKFDPQDPLNWTGLGACLRESGKEQKAIEVLKHAAQLEQSDTSVEIPEPEESVQRLPEEVVKQISFPQKISDDDAKSMWTSAAQEMKKYLEKNPNDFQATVILSVAMEEAQRRS